MRRLRELWRRLKSLTATADQLARIEGLLGDRLEHLLAEAQLERELAKPALENPKRLERYGFKALSEVDTDGILREIFRRVGEERQSFVEFGAAQGTENNTVYLLCQGWRGLWIEGSEALHQAQQRNFDWAVRAGTLASVRSLLTCDNINEVVQGAGFAGPIDLLSVDVDGNDYHLWEALTCVEPRVAVVEYNAYVPPPLRWVMAYDPAYRWDHQSTYYGASLASLEALGKRKGLRLVGCDVVGLNAFFVREDLCDNRFAQGDAQTFFHPRRWWLDRAFTRGSVPFGRPFAVK